MSDVLIFLGARRGASCDEHDMTGRGLLTFYSPAAGEERVRRELVHACKVEGIGGLTRMLQQYSGALFEVVVEQGDKTVRFSAYGLSYAPPTRALRLGPSMHRLEPLSPEVPIRLQVTERLLVPADSSQDEALTCFRDLLDNLPEDVAFTIRNAFVRPALEVRLDRIESLLTSRIDEEQRARAAPLAPPDDAASPWGQAQPARRPRIVLVFAVIAVTLLAAALAAFFFIESKAYSGKSSPQGAALPPEAAPTVEPAQSAAPDIHSRQAMTVDAGNPAEVVPDASVSASSPAATASAATVPSSRPRAHQ